MNIVYKKRNVLQKIIFLFLFCLIPKLSFASVFINEVAWMGSSSNANAEWIELYNNSEEDMDLSGWNISGSVSFTITEGVIVSGGFFLLERTSDDSVPEIIADKIYTGALANTGGSLILKDFEGNIIDEIQASFGWPAGDNTTKETMQKLNNAWYSGIPSPKAHTPLGIQQNTNNNINNSSNTSTSISSITNSAKTNVNTPKYREMSIKIILPQSNIPVGVPQKFESEILGYYGEKVERGKVVWNFGDGGIVEASSFEDVLYTYRHKGEYTVSLQYFTNSKNEDGDLEAKINIKVIEAELTISKIDNSKNPYIEIENKSSYEISLKDWQLIAGGKIFVFPSGTYIRAGRKTIFDANLLGFNSSDLDTVVLLRPGFQIESTYSNENMIHVLPKTKILNTNNTNNNLPKEEKNIIDFSDIDNLSSSTIKSTNVKSPIVLLSIVIIFGIFLVIVLNKRNIPVNDTGISIVNTNDIEIIE